jgi:hypothetical protein
LATSTVSTTESLALPPMLLVRVQARVPREHFQPLVESAMAVAVSSGGKVTVRTAELSIAVLLLVFVASIVTW